MMHRLSALLLFGVALLLGCSDAKQGSANRSPSLQDEAAPEVAMAEKGNQDAVRKPPAPAADKPTPRKIIYTGMVDLLVDDFDKADQHLQQLVAEHQGYVANSEIYNRPGLPRSGTWTVRLPQKQFDPFLDALVQFGEVRGRTTNSQDITDAYHDSAARLKADETEEKSLLGLLEKTQGKVEDILRVRDQLRLVRGEIEQRKSQLQRWDKDVDWATVTVKLLDRSNYTPPLLPDFGSTVGRTFQGSIDALVLFGKGIVLTVVALAPWLVVLALLGTPGFVMWRRRRMARGEVVARLHSNVATPSSGSDLPGGGHA